MQLVCRSLHGREWTVSVSPNSGNLGDVLQQIREQDSSACILETRAVVCTADFPQRLEPDTPLSEQGVTAGDTLVLLRDPLPRPRAPSSEAAPTAARVAAVTQHPLHDALAATTPPTDPSALYTDVIPVLAEISDTLQRQASDAPDLADEEPVDPSKLAMLVDMGFAESQAAHVLRYTDMDLEAAVQWLSSHDGDLPPLPAPSKKRGFTPNPIALQTMMDMGFAESDVAAALELTRNNQAAACELLLDGRDVQVALSMKKTTITRESPIVKAMLKDSLIFSALLNPRVRHALHVISQRTATLNSFSKDAVVGPVLHQISHVLQRS
eukprot:m.208655 g.208655  ORF g.208655 m.208655 type:complete len:325 (-) comp22080_c1_seq3:21-995(-)